MWVSLFAILFDETLHVVKIYTTGYVPVSYKVINLFIKSQNFLLMFFICKLKGLYLIIFFFYGLLMFFLYFVCKPLPNMGKQHITAVSSEIFCLWLLTLKYYLIHPLLIDLNMVFLRIFWSIYGCNRSGYTAHLIPLGVYFLTAMIFDNVCIFFVTFKCLTHFPDTCPGFFIDGRKA